MRPLQLVPAKYVLAVLIVALLGFADAAYLTVEHYQNVIPPCSLVSGCESVLTSVHSAIAGVPVSLLGAIYYFLVLIAAFAYLEGKGQGKREPAFRWALILTGAGFVASLWFLYLQAFVIHAYCLYCLGSLATSTVLFILALVIRRRFTLCEPASQSPLSSPQ